MFKFLPYVRKNILGHRVRTLMTVAGFEVPIRIGNQEQNGVFGRSLGLSPLRGRLCGGRS